MRSLRYKSARRAHDQQGDIAHRASATHWVAFIADLLSHLRTAFRGRLPAYEETGPLASALIAGIDEDRAERQLSLRFGHFSIPVLSQAWPGMARNSGRCNRLRGQRG